MRDPIPLFTIKRDPTPKEIFALLDVWKNASVPVSVQLEWLEQTGLACRWYAKAGVGHQGPHEPGEPSPSSSRPTLSIQKFKLRKEAIAQDATHSNYTSLER